MAERDCWARWVLERQFGPDPARRRAGLTGNAELVEIRDRLLANAAVGEGDTLLDVGCGSGLVAFAALEKVGASGAVVFGDVSAELLAHCRAEAARLGALDRCRFVRAPADDLGAIDDASVDAVTTRSVLIFVADKARAFAEFHRVLRPGRRLSIFEPINRFGEVQGGVFLGYPTGPVEELAERVRAVFRRIQPRDTDPMMNFDERDLLRLAEEAGFAEVYLALRARITRLPPRTWDEVVGTPGNPRIPSVEEAMREVLSEAERERLVVHLRPLVEAGGGRGRQAGALMWAIKGGG
jgi:ubiquinone/menaquinone biosynthesis C-methylase UbiE